MSDSDRLIGPGPSLWCCGGSYGRHEAGCNEGSREYPKDEFRKANTPVVMAPVENSNVRVLAHLRFDGTVTFTWEKV